MLHLLLVGGAVSLANIAVHAAVMVVVVATARRARRWPRRRSEVWLASVMIPTAGILMLAHVAEVAIWSLTYAVLGVTPAGGDLVYFAFVNYTTLGYGDVLPVPRWRLLGPATAMNGALLFGWSAAVMFEVLRSAINHLDGDGGRTVAALPTSGTQRESDVS